MRIINCTNHVKIKDKREKNIDWNDFHVTFKILVKMHLRMKHISFSMFYVQLSRLAGNIYSLVMLQQGTSASFFVIWKYIAWHINIWERNVLETVEQFP